MTPSYLFIPLVQEFIKKSEKSRRNQETGKRISPGTVDNYRYLLQHLQGYEETLVQPLRIRPANKLNTKQQKVEQNYWKRFHVSFCDYLHRQGCFDNYTGFMVKALRVVFRYIETEKNIQIGHYHKRFFIAREDIPVITLQPEQLGFLIYNQDFERTLSQELQTSNSGKLHVK